MAKRGRPPGSGNKGKKAAGQKASGAPKAKATKPVDETPEGISKTVQMISKGKLNSLLTELDDLKTQADRKVGAIRERIGQAKEKDHVHVKALAFLRNIRKMEAEEAALFRDTIALYMDHSGETERLDAVPEFNFVSGGRAVERAEPEDDPAEEEANKKVVPIKGRETAEKAGEAA